MQFLEQKIKGEIYYIPIWQVEEGLKRVLNKFIQNKANCEEGQIAVNSNSV